MPLQNLCTCLFGLGLILTAHNAVAISISEQTVLYDFNLNSVRSSAVRSLAKGGYELSDGTEVYFENWYSPKFPELNILALTALSGTSGILWGISTGEKGEKYQIDPGLWLGFVQRFVIDEHRDISLNVITLIGGGLREKTCVADYGDIGGIRQVNCRLAASVLPPDQTLDYLVRKTGDQETRISITYQIRF